eukprot:4078281-Pyramimonas_sp.AAC.1
MVGSLGALADPPPAGAIAAPRGRRRLALTRSGAGGPSAFERVNSSRRFIIIAFISCASSDG